jgi:hypothetical protein
MDMRSLDALLAAAIAEREDREKAAARALDRMDCEDTHPYAYSTFLDDARQMRVLESVIRRAMGGMDDDNA